MVNRAQIAEFSATLATRAYGASPMGFEFVRTTLDALPLAVYTSDTDGCLTYYNPACAALIGRSPVLGHDRWPLVSRLFRSDGVQLTLEEAASASILNPAETLPGEFIGERSDGTRFWCQLSSSPVFDKDGQLVCTIHVLIDVSALKRSEADKAAALRRTEGCLAGQKEAFQLAMSGQPLAASLDALIRTAVRYTEGNSRAAFFVVGEDGVGLRHVTGMGEAYAKDVNGFAIGPDSFACGLAIYSGEPFITRDVDEEPLWEDWRWMARKHGFRGCWSFPVRTEGGPILGTFARYFPEPRDPTEDDLELTAVLAHAASVIISRHTEAQERAQASRELQDADQRKDEFLATLAHELRSPLAPIRYSVQLAQAQNCSGQQREEAIAVIGRQAAHMARLLDDLLDISRITRGSLELRMEQVDLVAAISAAIEAARPLLDLKQHVLSADLPAHAVLLKADGVRLTQIFSNLLTNAAKYTDPGGRIDLTLRELDNELVVSVRDNGIGIAPETIPGLFSIFAQAKPALERSEGGLGIGLALVRGLVELHGGSIEARSEGENRGCEVAVRLPRQLQVTAGQLPESPAKTVTASAPLRVLVADDNHDSAEACAALLGIQGHEVRIAHSGRGALELAQSFKPQLALLDIGMPALNGYEVAQAIRSSEWGKEMTLVAITGWGQESAREQALCAGFDRHLTKPVDPDTLQALAALRKA